MRAAALQRLRRFQLSLGNLGDAVYDARYDGAEIALHIRTCDCGILNGVMEERRRDALRIKCELGERASDGKGVLNEGLARLARHASMRRRGDGVGAPDEVE